MGRARLKGILFDLDDTLIETTQALTVAFEQVLPWATRWYPDLTSAGLYQAMSVSYHELFGYGTDGYRELATLETAALRSRLACRALQRLDIQDAPFAEELWQRFAQAEQQNLRLNCGIAETLLALRPHFALGVITNGPTRLQREKLEWVGITSWFDTILTDAEHGCPKPELSVFRACQETLALEPEELMFVGDSLEADIRGAKRAGWWAVHLSAEPSAEADFAIPEGLQLLNLPPVSEALALARRRDLADTV